MSFIHHYFFICLSFILSTKRMPSKKGKKKNRATTEVQGTSQATGISLDMSETTEECCSQELDAEMKEFLEEFEEKEVDVPGAEEMMFLPMMLDYADNYTIRQLTDICHYYQLGKEVRSSKMNKNELIHFLVTFECMPENAEIVLRRQNLWFFMNELKADEYMRRFILW